jgi:hypothetical protein
MRQFPDFKQTSLSSPLGESDHLLKPRLHNIKLGARIWVVEAAAAGFDFKKPEKIRTAGAPITPNYRPFFLQ